MPTVDVTRVLLSSRFQTTLTVRRTAIVVSATGRQTETVTDTVVSGVVTTDAGRGLVRDIAGAWLDGSIMIHTTHRLQSLTSAGQADIILWHGLEYTVTRVDDNSHYGAGVHCAVAILRSRTQ